MARPLPPHPPPPLNGPAISFLRLPLCNNKLLAPDNFSLTVTNNYFGLCIRIPGWPWLNLHQSQCTKNNIKGWVQRGRGRNQVHFKITRYLGSTREGSQLGSFQDHQIFRFNEGGVTKVLVRNTRSRFQEEGVAKVMAKSPDLVSDELGRVSTVSYKH